MARKIIIDTDPGVDDAFALLLALGSPEIEVVGVTAVGGNVPLEQTATNARAVLDLAGRPDIPVHAGCPRPLVRQLNTARHVHGAGGLAGADLPPPSTPLAQQHGVDFLIDTVMAAPGEITLCMLGPLTNLAAAIVKQPEIAGRLRDVVIMGGCVFDAGNVTPAAEYNIHTDPHAAHVVFASGAPLTLVPTDCTSRSVMPSDWIGQLRKSGGRVATTAAEMAAAFQSIGTTRFPAGRRPLHDPCVIGWLLRPDLFEGRRCHVEVEIASPLTMGRTIVDWHSVGQGEPNAFVLNELAVEPFYDLLLERIARLP
jgi:purine nucleosidase